MAGMLLLHPASRQLAATLAILVALSTACLLVATSDQLPIVWDEGDALTRAAGIQAWLQRALSPPGQHQTTAWTAEAIAAHWAYTTSREGHPAFPGLLITVGQSCAPQSWSPLTASRLGAMLLFGLATGAMTYRLARDLSPLAGLVGAGALLSLPRMFSHAHFALGDGPLTSCWLLAWASFRTDSLRWHHALGFGFAMGLAFACKATGWLLPIPFAFFTLFHGDRRSWKTFAAALVVALLVFWLVNPTLWHHPWQGTWRFFELNLNRATRPEHNISTLFFGRMYNLDYPLPWYNTFVWVGITLPVGTLLLMLCGLVTACRPGQLVGQLLLANALTLLVVRALPGVPPHDGIRLMLPAFAFLAALAGLGASALAHQIVLHWPTSRRAFAFGIALPFLLLAGSATSVAWYWPVGLSHYNLLIGGLRGATMAGMEPTYFWDALDRPLFAWLEQNTRPEEKIRFSAAPSENLMLLRQWNILQRHYSTDAPGEFRWYVSQCRPSAYSAVDRWLIVNRVPIHQRQLHPTRFAWNPWQLDVPLIEVYDEADYQAARAAIDADNSAPP